MPKNRFNLDRWLASFFRKPRRGRYTITSYMDPAAPGITIVLERGGVQVCHLISRKEIEFARHWRMLFANALRRCRAALRGNNFHTQK